MKEWLTLPIVSFLACHDICDALLCWSGLSDAAQCYDACQTTPILCPMYYVLLLLIVLTAPHVWVTRQNRNNPPQPSLSCQHVDITFLLSTYIYIIGIQSAPRRFDSDSKFTSINSAVPSRFDNPLEPCQLLCLIHRRNELSTILIHHTNQRQAALWL